MSIKLMSAAWDLPIGSTEKMVLMCLCDHASDDGRCWPSVATISRKTSKSERTVQGALKWLGEQGYFSIRDVPGKGREYNLDPRRICTPAESAPPQISQEPPQNLRPTPAESAPKPSENHQEPSESTSPSDEVTVDHVFDHWNAKAPAWSKRPVRDRTPERKLLVRARIAQHGLDGWREVFGNFDKSSFLQSAKGCHFDWLIKKNNFLKVLEGNYNG